MNINKKGLLLSGNALLKFSDPDGYSRRKRLVTILINESILGNGGCEMNEAKWIKHNSDKCPIPWAKAGEFEMLDQFDEKKSWGTNCDAASLCWAPGFSFRLANSWIYVPGDGTIPEEIRGAKAGEWELRARDGSETTPRVKPDYYKSYWIHSVHPKAIIAVRLVKTASATETEKQRLTREAWQRYKAKNPDPIPFVPMRENEQYEIAAAALAEHDKIWPRKR